MSLPTAARALAAIAPLIATGGCTTRQGIRPQDMSVADHRRAAVAARDRSRAAAADADRGGRVASQHRATARLEADVAAAHADAADRLEAEVRSACEGVPPGELGRGMTGLPLVAASRLDRPAARFREVPEGVGFVVALRGRPFEAFAGLVRCRAARAAADRDAGDPLSVEGAYVRAYRDDGDAAVVQIVSRDPDRAQEVIRRVRSSGIDLGGAAREDRRDRDEGLGEARRANEPPDGPASPPRPPVGVDPVGGPPRPGGR